MDVLILLQLPFAAESRLEVSEMLGRHRLLYEKIYFSILYSISFFLFLFGWVSVCVCLLSLCEYSVCEITFLSLSLPTPFRMMSTKDRRPDQWHKDVLSITRYSTTSHFLFVCGCSLICCGTSVAYLWTGAI